MAEIARIEHTGWKFAGEELREMRAQDSAAP
jgi:hypothetical protein